MLPLLKLVGRMAVLRRQSRKLSPLNTADYAGCGIARSCALVKPEASQQDQLGTVYILNICPNAYPTNLWTKILT